MLSEKSGDLDAAISHLSKFIGRVVLTSDVVVPSRALAPVPRGLLTKVICDFLVTLDAAGPGCGKKISLSLQDQG